YSLNFDTVWFQQYGVPPHFGLQVRQFLNIFSERWFGSR
ncbi:hypothetical protein EAI_02729, partial [Harpegnathos saltator]